MVGGGQDSRPWTPLPSAQPPRTTAHLHRGPLQVFTASEITTVETLSGQEREEGMASEDEQRSNHDKTLQGLAAMHRSISASDAGLTIPKSGWKTGPGERELQGRTHEGGSEKDGLGDGALVR